MAETENCKRVLTDEGKWEIVCEDSEDGGGGDDDGDQGPKVGDTRTAETNVPNCAANGPPPNGGDALCTIATQTCEQDDGDNGIQYRIYTRTERWDGTSWVPISDWEYSETRCEYYEEEQPEVTPEVVLQRIEGWLPDSRVSIDPPNHRTLVNFENIVYTSDEDYEANKTILGQPVTVKAEQTEFEWDFGKNQDPETTTHGGRAYDDGSDPDPYIKHDYNAAGTYSLDVAVTWHVTYQVGGGPVQEAGTVTLDIGAPVELEVFESRTVLGE